MCTPRASSHAPLKRSITRREAREGASLTLSLNAERFRRFEQRSYEAPGAAAGFLELDGGSDHPDRVVQINLQMLLPARVKEQDIES